MICNFDRYYGENIPVKQNLFILTLFIIGIGFSQTESTKSDIPINTGARYVSGQDGVIRMYVNVWGHVGGPGRILVDDGIDLATLLSLTGGPNKGANMKNVRVYHEYPDKNGNIVNIIDFTEFLKTGDRSNFITIQPNDTFIIQQTVLSYIINEIGTVNTLTNLINMYLNLSNIL